MKLKKHFQLILYVLLLTLIIPITEVNAFTETYGDYAYETLQYIDSNFRERIAGSDTEKAMAEFIKCELQSFGYNVSFQEFNDSQNVIATKEGNSEKQIIVGAHYDSVSTAGVDDNGSGVCVVLETAKRMASMETPYTIKFILFGSEETGLHGSKAYVKSMSSEEKNNTLYMINVDSVLAGTYTYAYGGTYNKFSDSVKDSWAVEQAFDIASDLGLDLRSNDTELNYSYTVPTTGPWSDHESFKDFTPYIYFEATNWEVLDNPSYPEEGSTGWAETEIGEVMHNPERDDLTFIENQWGNRGKENISVYTQLLPEILIKIEPVSNNLNLWDKIKLFFSNLF